MTGGTRSGAPDGIEADPVGPEQARAAAQVGPALLLHVGHHDELPLQSLGPVGGEQAHGRAADAPLGERVAGDLLGDEVGEERGDADVVAVLDRAGRHLEERADRVEVLVRPARPGAALVDLATQPLGPGGARPEVPQDVLDAGALLEQRGPRAQQRRQGAAALDLRPVEVGEEAVGDDGEPQQLPAGAGCVAGLVTRAQAAYESAQVAGVEPAQGRQQQRLDPAGVEEVG